MTKNRRLIAVVGALAAVALLVGAAVTRTSAAWTDAAVVAAQATSGTWAGDESTCEVVSVSTGEVVGSCSVDAVTIGEQWPQGMRFAVTIGSFNPSGDVQARVTVDMSTVLPDWNWSASGVQMDNAVSLSWSAPTLTFTTVPWHGSPFGGTVYLTA